MFGRAVLAGFLIGAVAGCGPATDAADNGQTRYRSIKIRNSYQESMLKLPESERDITLRRAVRDNGGSCPKITGSAYQEDYKNMAMWVAHCSSGDWAVFLAPSGTVQARKCSEAAQLKLPACKPGPKKAVGEVPAPRWPEPPPAPSYNSL
jgi:hypothetical protein